MTGPVGHLHGNRLPTTGAGFIWDAGAVPVLRPETDRAVAAYTTRIGGTSAGPFASLNLTFVSDDDPEAVAANRSIAGETVGRDGRWAVCRQVHGANVGRAAHGELPDADALWTDADEDTIAVLSADCVLLLAVGPERLGVAHAGWRGLIEGVVGRTVEATAALEVFAGPAIGPCCFEVSGDVVEAFSSVCPEAITDERHVDLWVAAEAAARAAGAAAVRSARICTSCHPELFFSHRRDSGRTGRQALIAHV
jgi:YfiH family protein